MTYNSLTTKPPSKHYLPPQTPAEGKAMDVSSLIQMVREREPLWNRQHPQYKDRELAATLWGQVASQLKVDVETARYKWRGLRDTYRVQLRKLKRPDLRVIKQQTITSRWEYFHEMSFVKDHIYLDVNSRHYKTKRLKGESPDFDGYEEEHFEGEDGSGDDEYHNFGELCETEMTEGDQVLDESFHRSDNSINDINGDSLEDIPFRLSCDEPSEKHLNNTKESYFINGHNTLEDDNFCFLLSILPQLKSLPSKRNLYVRIKIQELLLNEVIRLHNEA